MSEEARKALMQKYKNPIVLVIEEKTKVGGSWRHKFYIEYRLIHCLQNGLSLNWDVYDLAE